MLTQQYLESLSFKVIGCIFEVNRCLGPGLLESVYQSCLMHEFHLKNLYAVEFSYIPVIYKDQQLKVKFQPDIIVENELLLELKSVETMIPLYHAHLLTYLKLSGKMKGLLVNFNSVNIREQIHSIVLPEFFKLPK